MAGLGRVNSGCWRWPVLECNSLHASAPAPAPQLPLSACPHPPSQVHNLALSVPGVEQLMVWVLSGGLGACLPTLDLGLQLAENQAGVGWSRVALIDD